MNISKVSGVNFGVNLKPQAVEKAAKDFVDFAKSSYSVPAEAMGKIETKVAEAKPIEAIYFPFGASTGGCVKNELPKPVKDVDVSAFYYPFGMPFGA